MKKYYNLYQDVWNLHKKYINCYDNSDEFWLSIVTDIRAIAKKYNYKSLVNKMLFGVLDEFKELVKKKESENLQYTN